MRTPLLAALLLVAATVGAGAANAECYADYKASRQGSGSGAGGLQLHYGVAQIPDGACGDRGAAARALAPRLAQDGWTLLNIVSIFGAEGLDQRKASAGRNFLRY